MNMSSILNWKLLGLRQ